MMDLSASPAELHLTVILLTVTACYLVYHYALDARRFLPPDLSAAPDRALRALAVQRIGGAAILGLPPTILVLALAGHGPSHIGLGVPHWGPLAAYVLGLGALLLPVITLASRKADFREHYPELRLPPDAWTPARMRRNRLLWGIYLFGYEVLFRGVLLFGLIPFVGVWPAIAIQTAFYAAVHLPKNAGECAGSAVMGTLFSLGALWSGSVLAPWLLHWMVATAGETLGLRAQLRAQRPESTEAS
ncbi:MAG: CPBP family intramembrane metalloprotease [Deltaproteobacteria bacterium]|nr:MAG: CPBP family intramembrane metalloprotease [Deltaproteobacteria bacterium]